MLAIVPGDLNQLPPVDPAKMAVDIRARILWGDKLDAIRSDWQKKGASDVQITSALKAAEDERQQHFRSRGILDLTLAAGAWIATAFLWWLWLDGWRSGRLMVLMAVAPMVAFWFSSRGVVRVFRGGDADEAASDIDHSK